MFRLIKHSSVQQLIILVSATGLLFSTTQVAKVSSFIVIIGFTLLTLTIYYLIRCLLSLSKLYGLKIRRQRSLAMYLTLIVGILLALQSIGELGSRDVWVLLPLAILGYGYSSYAKTSRL